MQLWLIRLGYDDVVIMSFTSSSNACAATMFLGTNFSV